MNNIAGLLNRQSTIFFIGLMIFFIAAFWGWEKLQYGFNFIDEGYYMTEGWRLAAGDDLLKDKFTGALMQYTFFNKLVFELYPDIKLLDFRRLQYFLTILCLIILGITIYKIDKQYCYLPYILSLFAFTGLDGTGMVTNLSYQTYPHLFLVLHVACLIMGMYSERVIKRNILFVCSGVFLWCISISLLHLSLVVFAPVMIFMLIRKNYLKAVDFSLKDLFFTLGPFFAGWLILIGVDYGPFIRNAFYSAQMILSTESHSVRTLTLFNIQFIKHFFITSAFVLTFFFALKMSRIIASLLLILLLSAMMFIVIHTSLWGYVEPYWKGLFGGQMWFACTLISSTLIYWLWTLKKLIRQDAFTRNEEIAICLMAPSSIIFLSGSVFSGLGIITILQCAIPIIAGITMAFIAFQSSSANKVMVNAAFIVLFFMPFYITTSLADWQFTYFDVAPTHAKVIIEDGFGANIRTNSVYKNLYEWIEKNAKSYSKDGDFIISYAISPMVHMIAKRRPALDDSFITMSDRPVWYLEKSIEFMKERKRLPQMAFVFESMPALMPISYKDMRYAWFGREFDFLTTTDPISKYIIENMTLVDEFIISGDEKVRCFVASNKENEH